jgi:CheY-like chemotaxis protein
MEKTSMLGISTGTETIVLLESEPETRRLVSQILSLAGYTVREASDGAEAVRQIEEGIHTADLLLADIAAPAMSSGELAQRLVQQYPNLRLLLTAEPPGDQAVQSVLPAGAQVLAKPFSPGALMSKVREVLDGPFACPAARQAAASGGYPAAG